ncbi:TMEM165/GDT1 family protein [Halorubellus sp. PRR65]|uniref:TMEM165/GDT1 family protein n=1 Tax=Halorubellus sp. PRR65 TaxID=3098148 RepID=UPI002B25F5F3|nr:TMEM165/GDT1 family protein [Halorubellus sp. PRR65]
MTDVPFWELVVIAALAQLTVLPGEKVQFIIAGLSTRYNPLVVVAAAGSAFALWTVAEIQAGSVIQQVLPGFWLDVFTGAMFLVFAVLLVRSAPERGESGAESASGAETDGGLTAADAGGMLSGDVDDVTVFGRQVPNVLGGFVPIFAMMFTGEFGDKTQIITITLAADYGARAGIWVGEMLAIVPVSLANAYFFYTFSHRFDVRKAHYVGAGVFAFFAFDTALSLVVGVSLWERFVTALTGALAPVLDAVANVVPTALVVVL